MRIKSFVIKHRKLDYIQKCIRYSTNEAFVEKVLGIDRDPNYLFFDSYGQEYLNHIFYDVFLDFPSKGFFAMLIQTLDALRYAERYNLTPVVTWSDRCLYKEKTNINGSDNPFCYYYEPVSEFDREMLKNANRVLRYNSSQRALNRSTPFTVVAETINENDLYDWYIHENALVFKKYIRMKEPVACYVKKSLDLNGFNGGNKILGVHVRATDFNKNYIHHAVAVSENEYIKATKKAMESNHFDRIYLATDEKKIVDDYTKVFGNMVFCSEDTYRSNDGTAVHFSEGVRENHKYLLGLEVIRDMYLLSKCDGLIGSFSNVCIAAQIARKSGTTEYKYLNIIDKGFNKAGQTPYQDHFSFKRKIVDYLK